MAERDTPRRTGMIDFVEGYEVAASTKIEAGKLVCLDASGNAVEYVKSATNTANNLVCVGRCESTVDNSSGSAGDKKVLARVGVFSWKNMSTDKLTKAEIGDAVHAEDDETARKTAQTGNKARTAKIGRLISVDDDGAWVATGIPFLY